MGSRQLAPKGMRRVRSEGLDGGLVGILYGPGITGGSFPLLYRKSAGPPTVSKVVRSVRAVNQGARRQEAGDAGADHRVMKRE